jgi:chromosome partitioning protein
VTPINDSFVDFDLIGQVDAENFKVRKLSFYAELIWEARKERAKADGVTIDWVVVRNRLHNMEARNQQRMTEAIAELSKRVGFRSVPGLN